MYIKYKHSIVSINLDFNGIVNKRKPKSRVEEGVPKVRVESFLMSYDVVSQEGRRTEGGRLGKRWDCGFSRKFTFRLVRGA